jgi:hypothetical protein
MVVRHRSLTLLGQELTKILSKNKKTWLRKWIFCQEPLVALQTRLGTWDFQTTNRTMPYHCIKRKLGGGGNKDTYCHCTVKSITKTSSLQMKKCLLWRKLSISKTIEFMHGYPRKPMNWCQGSNEVIILPQSWFPMMASLICIFVKRALKKH